MVKVKKNKVKEGSNRDASANINHAFNINQAFHKFSQSTQRHLISPNQGCLNMLIYFLVKS